MITAIIQARLSSKRLPKKLIMKIEDKTLLEHLFTQLSYSKQLEKKIIATTQNKIDDEIIKIANSLNISYFRGNSENVLDRFYECAKLFDIETSPH